MWDITGMLRRMTYIKGVLVLSLVSSGKHEDVVLGNRKAGGALSYLVLPRI